MNLIIIISSKNNNYKGFIIINIFLKILNETNLFQVVEGYMAYLTDMTDLISNPGIRPGVRQDVLKVVQITSAWKNMSYDRFVKFCDLKDPLQLPVELKIKK